MKIWVLLSLLLFLVGIQTTWAAGPVLPQILSSSASSQGEQSINVVPDPAALRGDWWSYFNVPPDQLASRADRLNSLLKRRYLTGQQADPENVVSDARRAAISRIASNLDAFQAARLVEPPTPLVFSDLSEIYTPGQALVLVGSLRQARTGLQFDKNDVTALDEAAQASRRELDAEMGQYLQLDALDASRVDIGLAVIGDRLALETTEIQLNLRRAGLQVREQQVESLAEAERRAEQRLRGDAQEGLTLSRNIRAATLALETARISLANEKRRMLQSTAETVQNQASTRYRQQRVTHASIRELAARLELRLLQTQVVLNNILLEDVTTSMQEGHEQVELTRQAIGEGRNAMATLSAASERERDRAGEQLASAGDARTDSLVVNQRRLRLAQESVGQLRLLNDQIVKLEFLTRWTSTAIRTNEGFVDRTLNQISDLGGRFSQSVGAITDKTLFRLGETPITLSGIFKVIVVVLIAWLVSWIFRRMIGQLGHRFPRDNQSILFVISRLAHYLIILIGIVAGLSSIGLSFANFALVAGALALGLGFGLQSIVNNFLSGLILFFERTVKVGDFVQLDNGEQGEVRSINVRGTIVNTNDNVDVIVPNSEFTEQKVVNWTLLDPFRRIHVPFRVAYDSNEDVVVEAGLDAATRLSSTLTGVLGREPSVWLVNYGENGLDFELIVWLMPDAVKRPDAVFAAYHWEIRKALRRFEVEVPVPQREIRFRQPLPPALEGSASPTRR
ncbi:MAG: mechanosensitive ion channel domain-containing protein [Burkholderiaceae bacterium]